ncbi:uridine kinase [Bacillus sp. FSL W7-1360]
MIIAIAAVSGGGKTTVARALASKLPNAYVLHFDDYELEGPSDLCQWIENGANYDEWKVNPIIRDINILRDRKKCDFIILDYPFSYLQTQMRDLIDLSFYIDTPLDIAFARRIIRQPPNLMSELVDDCTHYLNVSRKAYTHMNDVVKPSADDMMNGQSAVDEIVRQMVGVIHKRRSTES